MKRGKFMILVALIFIYASASGQYLQYEETAKNAMLLGIIDTVVISFTLMIAPAALRFRNEKPFSYDKGKKICMINSWVIFISSIFLAALGLNFIFIGGFGAIIYYYINMSLTTEIASKKRKA